MDKIAKQSAELRLDGDNAEEWKFFVQKFNIYLKASKSEEETEKYKEAVLLNCIGDKALKIYNTFIFNEEEKKKVYSSTLKKFDEHFIPTRNVTYERYIFFSRDMRPEESVDHYITELKKLSENCEFGALREELIKDRLVLGIKNKNVKDRLLRTKKLDLVKASEICKSAEITSMQLDVLCGGGSSSATQKRMEDGSLSDSKVMKVARRKVAASDKKRDGCKKESSEGQRQVESRFHPHTKISTSNKNSFVNSNTKFDCNKCGTFHKSGQCKAYGKKCWNCNQYNHFGKLCRNKTLNNIDSCKDELFIGLVENSRLKKENWMVDLKIFDKIIRFRVDSGADVNVIPFSLYKKHFGNNKIKSNNTNLTEYTGSRIDIIGYITVPVNYQNNNYNIDLYIAKGNGQSVLGIDTIEELDVARMVRTVVGTRNYFENTQNYVEKFPDVFKGIGCLPGQYRIKVDPTVKPCVHAARRFPQGILVKLKDKLKNLESQDIIAKEFGPTEWVNSLVIVDKPNGDFRICIDPTNLNKAIKREHFLIPTFTDIVTKLEGAKFFSVLDTNNGFWNVELDRESSKLCTFNTPFGRYRFKRLPFGLKCSSEVFQRKILQCFEGIEGVEIYIDDVLVWGRTKEEHDERLDLVLDRARKFNVKFNPNKCKFSVNEVNYLGHKITDEGIKPDDSKIEAIVNYPVPSNTKELQSFLGIVNYLHKFIPNVADKTKPLRDLLKKNALFQWEYEQQQVFEELKTILIKEPVLRFYNPNKILVLTVDASSDGLGAALLQEGKPIACAPRSLNSSQKCYAQIEKEMLAIVYGAKKFHQYVYGKKIVVETDHKPLVQIFKKPLIDCPMRLQRMLLDLQIYDLEIRYRPGKEMYISDALSRIKMPPDETKIFDNEYEAQVNYLKKTFPITREKNEQFQLETRNDKTLQIVTKYIKTGWPNSRAKCESETKLYFSVRSELVIVDNLIYKGNCLVVPESLRKNMLDLIHLSHLGVTKCILKAREILYWPGMYRDIHNRVLACEICQKYSRNNFKEPLIPHKVPDYPWQKVGCDLYEINNHKFIIVIDYYSKYVEVCKVNNITADTIIKHLKNIFSRLGIPQVFVSDNGTQFAGFMFENFVKSWNFKHVTSSPMYAKSNGMVERAIQTVKNIIKKCIESNTEMELALLDYRNTPVDYNIPSPCELLFSRKTQSLLPIKDSLLHPKCIDFKKQRQLLSKRQAKQKMYYDRSATHLKSLNVNEKIYIRKDDVWVIGYVVKKFNDRSYLVKEHNSDVVLRRNRYFLKPYFVANSGYMSESECLTDVTVEENQCVSDEEKILEKSDEEIKQNVNPTSSITRRTIYVSKTGRKVRRPERL